MSSARRSPPSRSLRMVNELQSRHAITPVRPSLPYESEQPSIDQREQYAQKAQYQQPFMGHGTTVEARTNIGTPVSSSSGDDSYTVRVVLRCRPMNETERARNDDEVVKLSTDRIVNLIQPGPGGHQMQREYEFNHIFGPQCQQEEFFEKCGIKDLLNSALGGYAATVFAYGQTGSGKTYSMSGIEEKIVRDEWDGREQTDGIIPRAIKYLFEVIENHSRQYNVTTRASYCEIYNEQVYDLLNMSSASLPVRWNAKSGFFVQDLFVVECQECADVMAIVSEGQRNRRVGSHELNKDSSRSHSILSIHIETEVIDPDDGHTRIKYGKIVFVDLAGSERLKDTKSAGVTLTETGAINKSLFTLSKVISSLSDRKKASGFVPYRDSKLTKLLMDSLGGNSLTLMITCCSPSSIYLEETANSLNYAMRAKCIKNKPTIHMDPKEQLIFNLKQDVKLLRMENAYFRSQLGYQPEDLIEIPPEFQATPRRGSTGSIDQHLTPRLGLPAISMSNASQPTSGRQTSNPKRSSPPGLGSLDFGPPGLVSPREKASSSPRVQSRTTSTLYPVPFPSAGAESVAAIQPIMEAYQQETERLRIENKELRVQSGYTERSYKAAMSENERLSRKLEHLEEIFVQKGKKAPWPIPRSSESASTHQGESKHPGDTFPQEKGMTIEEQQELREQNERLVHVVKGLTVENTMMVKRIKVMEHTMMQHQ